MRIVREQMLCIISEGWSQGEEPFSGLSRQLEQLFQDAGVVHFASIGLLPPRPGEPEGALPSLMLELAVDEGLRPRDLLASLAHHPAGTLAQLYGEHLGLAPELPFGERNEAVLQHLLACLSVADGGFVGPRDRTLAQVREERSLYEKVRNQTVNLPAAARTERTPFARALANWARAEPGCDCATRLAPRSFWRAQAGMVKFLYFAVIVGAIFLAAWLGAAAFRALGRLWIAYAAPYLPEWFAGPVATLLGAVAVVSTWVMDVGVRSALVLFIGGIAFGGFVVASAVARKFVPAWSRWVHAIAYELDRPTDAWSARLAHVFMWLVVACVGVYALVVLGFVLAGERAFGLASRWLWAGRPAWLDLLLFAFAAVFFALLLVLAVGLRSAMASAADPKDDPLKSALKRFRRWLHRPRDQQIERAQQVHSTIERCEAEDVAGVSHLVSLTELKHPYVWSAFWTRLSLRLVTAFGYVFFTEGSLGNAPGIQFSHWHIIDRGRRLLFCANFDGTFGGYLDDFIKGPSIGTTLFWRWTELRKRTWAVPGHPAVVKKRPFAPTRLIVYRGVKCELRFKTYARESMLPRQFRFVATNLTLEQKNRATSLRDALCGERTDANDDLIMRALES